MASVAQAESSGIPAETAGLQRGIDWTGAFWIASGVPALVLFSIGTIAASVGMASWLVWMVSILFGFVQAFSYAEIAGMFPNKSGGASVYGAVAWARYSKLFAPVSVWCNWLAWSPVLTIGSGLAASLAAIQFPAAFIDYESSNPAFPMYQGTRPYQQICFQWSAHVLESPDSEPIHFEFLAECREDPREAFCRTLWEVIKDCPAIVHYTGYEITQLKAMATDGIPLAAELLEAIETRSVDLEKIVSEHLYFEEFNGKTSIKVVLPALVPTMSYKELLIADGTAAATGFRSMLDPATPKEEAATLRAALLEYCCQDTLAMVEIDRKLRILTLGK